MIIYHNSSAYGNESLTFLSVFVIFARMARFKTKKLCVLTEKEREVEGEEYENGGLKDE